MASALTTASPSPALVHIGRPSGYNPSYCDKVIEYFCRYREPRTIQVASEDSDEKGSKVTYRQICAELPTLAGFCIEVGISRETLYRWQEQHGEFRDACARARLVSEELLQDRANNGLYNAQFAAFFGKNAFGWKDKTEVETVSSKDSQDMAGMRAALAAASPEQLKQFSELIAAMQSRVPAVSQAESDT